jgi:Fe-S-cluster formation regulator IscX/YfhJ
METDTEAENQMSVGELLMELEHTDPECFRELNAIIEDWNEFVVKKKRRNEKMLEATKRYFQTQKGKEARRKAQRKYYLVKKERDKQKKLEEYEKRKQALREACKNNNIKNNINENV